MAAPSTVVANAAAARRQLRTRSSFLSISCLTASDLSFAVSVFRMGARSASTASSTAAAPARDFDNFANAECAIILTS